MCDLTKLVKRASPCECPTFALATIAPMVNANVKHNPNPNPNPDPTLNPYPTLNQKPNHYPHSNSLLLEISSQEQLLPEQMLDHRPCKRGSGAKPLAGVQESSWFLANMTPFLSTNFQCNLNISTVKLGMIHNK